MNVRLISKTEGAKGTEYEGKSIDEIIVGIARLSSSRETNELFAEPYKLIRHCIQNGHWSIFSMANLTFEIETSRAIGRELLRHWSLSPQELCLSGDTEVYFDFPCGKGKSRLKRNSVKIKDLYEKIHKGSKPNRETGVRNNIAVKILNKRIRSFNSETRTLKHSWIKDVFYCGPKELYEIELECGKKIKTTRDHKFFIKGKGWLSLDDAIGINLSSNGIASFERVESFATNGVVAWKDKEWMQEKKQEAIDNKKGLPYIAEEAGCSYDNIRKWLKIHGLSFTKKEVASYTAAWNNGKTGYRLGPHSEESKEKMRASARRGSSSNLWRGGVDRNEKQKIRDWVSQNKYRILFDRDFKCENCGEEGSELHLHHIVPLYENITLGKEESNLQVLCRWCHSLWHHENGDYHKFSKLPKRKKICKWSKIKYIKYVGVEDTYDLEIWGKEHCYVANGIVVHNSQRYKSVTEFEPIELRMQSKDNRQSSTEIINNDSLAFEVKDSVLEAGITYQYLLEKGVSRETARFVLPECTQTTLIMNGKVRDWITMLNQRLHKTAQKECRMVAECICDIFRKECPLISEALFNFSYAEKIHILDQVVLEKYKQRETTLEQINN